MFHQFKDRLGRQRFKSHCRKIFETPPICRSAKSGLAVLSQLQHKDVMMYLLAIKSFAHWVPVASVHIVDDGSLTPSDRSQISEHVPGVEFLAIAEFRNASCPQGGTWERLIAIAQLVRRDYVVQLDSDTLALGDLPEVRGCVDRGTAFAIGTWDDQTIETMGERARDVQARRPTVDSHVQLVAEAHFDRLPGFEHTRYLRGCSGFAGFPRGCFDARLLEETSRRMQSAIGDKWSEWGSEQVMSNIVVANAPSAMVLPHPRYANCNKTREGETVFIHFIGTCRFSGTRYARLGEVFIVESLRRNS